MVNSPLIYRVLYDFCLIVKWIIIEKRIGSNPLFDEE
ncbi:hypothetical protein EZS27_014574 [termite gut metagenome]|uniref:Uncharacterized protein n=1 Tax=termite gut metagenome TaxID=433724 RepID=A0A5J4RW18_9ZZZZ